ncbi:MAG TPA: TniQ family protein [Actinocrinis sp.]|uniref:TniQ family protein n=1 Tax=Actinocrinis sp. TaxID=1920516 RepID=UPI002DDD1AA5|nr:TniQ family protein [Actinocrinis sp.]HEV2345151.1 TniQ family protein [Actinocrinis sp.]
MSRPFGRSLDPLPEEDLGGYLLRLAAHLCMPPVTLARRLGLVNNLGPQVVRKLLIPGDVDELAILARLTREEARALTLNEWEDRYPPIATALAGAYHMNRSYYGDGVRYWLYAATPRRCPSCLAGNGSEIQRQYGGAWRKAWRLPLAFACVAHRLFLAEECQTPHAEQLGAPLLIPNASISGLHPAQCRLPRRGQYGHGSQPCGSRLDRLPDSVAIRPGRNHLEAQQRILHHLRAESDPSDATRYFADIALVTTFLNVLPSNRWDEIGTVVGAAIADTITRYEPPYRSTFDRPPRDVLSTATMLTAVTTILNSTDQQAELARLAYQSAGHPLRLRALKKIWIRYARTCSPTLNTSLNMAWQHAERATRVAVKTLPP